MSRPELVAYVDEKLRNGWSPEQIAGEFAWTIPRIKPCVSARKASTAGFMRPRRLEIQAIAIYAAPTDTVGGKPGMAGADGCFRGVSIHPGARRLLLADPGLGTGRPILSAPPGARRRRSAATKAKAAFWCWPGLRTRRPPPRMRHSFPFVRERYPSRAIPFRPIADTTIL